MAAMQAAAQPEALPVLPLPTADDWPVARHARDPRARATDGLGRRIVATRDGPLDASFLMECSKHIGQIACEAGPSKKSCAHLPPCLARSPAWQGSNQQVALSGQLFGHSTTLPFARISGKIGVALIKNNM